MLTDTSAAWREGGRCHVTLAIWVTSAETNLGSSAGRGTRCSGWFADYLAEKGDSEMQSLTLAGGIKGWVKAGEAYTSKVDGYEPEYWKQFDEKK